MMMRRMETLENYGEVDDLKLELNRPEFFSFSLPLEQGMSTSGDYFTRNNTLLFSSQLSSHGTLLPASLRVLSLVRKSRLL